nr:alpha/beta hydrolase [Hyella patelloides]
MEFKNNLEHNYIISNGIRLHYVTQGEGELILLLHGFPEFWYSWRHQIPELAKNYKVVALDLRGYNDSEKPQAIEAYAISELLKDIEGVIKGLGYETCILVGHDWGGVVAWHFAYTYSDMVKKLIVMNLPHPSLFAQAFKSNPQQMLRSWYAIFFQLPSIPEFLFQANNYSLIAAAFTETATNKTAFTQQDLEAYKEAAAKPGALTAMINYYRCNFKGISLQQEWRVLEIPTMLIWGENDTALGKELTYNTQEYVRDFQLHYISNSGHWVQQEQPELVNQYLQEFLDINQ